MIFDEKCGFSDKTALFCPFCPQTALAAKSSGVRGAEIWYLVGPTPPTDPEQCKFAAVDTSTPYLLQHDPADGGKTAHYLLRWVNTRGEAGPWSETVSATIGA